MRAQSCPTLCDLMDGSPLGASAHGISPGKNTGVGSISISRRSSDPGIELESLTSPALSGRFFTTCATWEAPGKWKQAFKIKTPILQCSDHLSFVGGEPEAWKGGGAGPRVGGGAGTAVRRPLQRLSAHPIPQPQPRLPPLVLAPPCFLICPWSRQVTPRHPGSVRVALKTAGVVTRPRAHQSCWFQTTIPEAEGHRYHHLHLL